MILRDNPVLSRELLVNLRDNRSFLIQLLYVAGLGAMVYLAWPVAKEGYNQVSSGAAQSLFDLFFFGQFFLVALVSPAFAAGSISGEKERKTYELLLASPLRPSTILLRPDEFCLACQLPGHSAPGDDLPGPGQHPRCGSPRVCLDCDSTPLVPGDLDRGDYTCRAAVASSTRRWK